MTYIYTIQSDDVSGGNDKGDLPGCYFETEDNLSFNFYDSEGTQLNDDPVVPATDNKFSFPLDQWNWTFKQIVVNAGVSLTGKWTNTDPHNVSVTNEDGNWTATTGNPDPDESGTGTYT